MKEKKLTPMMVQYLEVKKQYPDCLLFYRLGDFYELFFEDAKTASSFLGLVLTSRNKNGDQQVPMCGIPFHAYHNYLTRLVKGGFKVGSDFAYAGTMVKSALLGIAALFDPGKELMFDRKTQRFTNSSAANARLSLPRIKA